ncbi:MAG TPA: oligosaccharide flippase family protein [Pyrinomonadaceae bacterium]|nr:oligosaccharide flippase family protein [Pyrinomonadaceae bacterium]
MKNQLSSSVSVRMGAKVFYMVTRLFLPPLILSYVTLEEYGIWAACFILISYLGMSAFGVSNIYIRYTAEYQAKGEIEKINQLISTGIVAISGISLVALGALYFLLPWFVNKFHISQPLHRTAFILIFGTALSFMLDLTLGSFAYVLHGLQRITQQTFTWIVGFCVEAVLIVVLLYTGAGIYALLIAFMVRNVISGAACLALCYRALPSLSIRLKYFDRASLRLFFGYGLIVQVSGLLATFLYSIEKVLAGVFLGVAATGLLDIGQKLPVMASQIPSGMNEVFLPAMSRMHGLDQKEELHKLFLKGSRYLNMLTGLVMGFFAAFAAPLMMVWLGARQGYGQAATILAIFTLPYQMNVLTGPGSALHRGVNKPARELVYPLSQMALVALTVSIGFWWQGRTLIVIAVAVSLAMVLSVIVYMAYTNKVLGISQRQFAWRVLAPGLVPYFVGFGMFFATRSFLADLNRISLLIALGVIGCVYSLFSMALIYRGLCDWGEREFMRHQFKQTLGGFLKRKPGADIDTLEVKPA